MHLKTHITILVGITWSNSTTVCQAASHCSVFQYSLHCNITVSLISLIVLFSLVTAVQPDSFLNVLLKTSSSQWQQWMILLWTKSSMDTRTDSMASQLILPKKNVMSMFFLRNWKIMFSAYISVSVSHTFYSEWFWTLSTLSLFLDDFDIT